MKTFLQFLAESVYKHAADQTIFVNPTHAEFMKSARNTSRGTMMWDVGHGKWYLSDDDVTHGTLSVEVPLDSFNVVNFYATPSKKLMSLGYNHFEEDEVGYYIPYAEIKEDRYWQILEADGWTLRDESGEFGSEGLDERIKNHPIKAVKAKKKAESQKRLLATVGGSDEALLKKLGL